MGKRTSEMGSGSCILDAAKTQTSDSSCIMILSTDSTDRNWSMYEIAQPTVSTLRSNALPVCIHPAMNAITRECKAQSLPATTRSTAS